MKVEVDVSKDSLVIKVDNAELDVYGDLGKEFVGDSVKKGVWLSSIAYEVRRRLFRFVEVEKKRYMNHWKEWAVKWLKVRGMKDTQDNIESCVSQIFGECDISEKIKYFFDIRGMNKKNTSKYESWRDFFNDDDISEDLKNMCREMYKVEFKHNMSFDKVIEIEARMASIVASLKDSADGYKRKSEEEKQLKF